MAKKPSKGNSHSIPKVEINLELSPDQEEDLLNTLKVRFEKNMNRHKGLEWSKIQAKLEAHPEKLSSLNAMESTGGEPDAHFEIDRKFDSGYSSRRIPDGIHAWRRVSPGTADYDFAAGRYGSKKESGKEAVRH